MQGSGPPTSGGRCFAGGGGQAPALQGAALPPAVGDERRRCRVPALHVRWSVFRRRRGTSPSPTLGRRRVPPAAGDECRRCRVPALPRPVVGVSPAAGDKPQPYIRIGGVAAGGGGWAPAIQGAALPPAGWGWVPAGVTGGGVAAGGTLGRRLLYGRTVELLHVAE